MIIEKMIRNIKLTVPKIHAPKYRLLAGNPFNFFKTQRTAKKKMIEFTLCWKFQNNLLQLTGS